MIVRLDTERKEHAPNRILADLPGPTHRLYRQLRSALHWRAVGVTMARAVVINKERNASDFESVATWQIVEGALVVRFNSGDELVFAQGEWIYFAMRGD